jgi:hypothetical protein
MTSQVLLTHHHHQAMENAAERGFWMPLPLQGDQLSEVRYLSAISRGQGQITALVEITSFEPWRDGSGVEQWLPFVGQRLELPHPIPLGNRRVLAGWLPQRRDQSQILDLLALLAVERLSDLVVPADPQGARLGCCCGGAPQLTGARRMACGSAACKSRSLVSGRE